MRYDRFASGHVVNRVLLKIASRCNFGCEYCYWFKDDGVYQTPAVLTQEAEESFLRCIDEHIQKLSLQEFSVSFHGGEPLLIGCGRFARLCLGLRAIEVRTKCRIRLSLQTNGSLIDYQWIQLFRLFQVSVGISLDGPMGVNDISRVDLAGRGTHQRTIKGLKMLQDAAMDPGILAVWSDRIGAVELSEYFVQELGVAWFDVLLPDITFDDKPDDVADFYIDLFDHWFFDLHQRGVTVRCAKSYALATLGLPPLTESVGHSPVTTFAVNTAGDFEILDVLNIVGHRFAETGLSVFKSSLDQIRTNDKWLMQVRESLDLHTECDRCTHKSTCGGGYLPTRFSSKTGFRNPSAYCVSLKKIFSHVADVIDDHLTAIQGALHGTAESHVAGYAIDSHPRIM